MKTPTFDIFLIICLWLSGYTPSGCNLYAQAEPYSPHSLPVDNSAYPIGHYPTDSLQITIFYQSSYKKASKARDALLRNNNLKKIMAKEDLQYLSFFRVDELHAGIIINNNKKYPYPLRLAKLISLIEPVVMVTTTENPLLN